MGKFDWSLIEEEKRLILNGEVLACSRLSQETLGSPLKVIPPLGGVTGEPFGERAPKVSDVSERQLNLFPAYAHFGSDCLHFKS